MEKKDYMSVELINYPLSAIRFQESQTPIDEEKKDVVGVLFALQLTGELSSLLISLSHLTGIMFNKDWIKENINPNGETITFKEYIDTLYKIFKDIMKSKENKFSWSDLNLTHNDTSSFINPYIMSYIKYEKSFYRKNQNVKIEPGQYKIVRSLKPITKEDLSHGLIIIPFIKSEKYSENLLETNFIKLRARLIFTKRLCEEVCNYYTSLDKKQQEEYKDAYEHTKQVVEILGYLLESGLDETLYEPLIRYVLPISFTPQNIDGRLYMITIKLSMFYKKKSPDELINDLIERKKKANRFARVLSSDEVYKNKIDEASKGNFQTIYDLMQNVYRENDEEGRQNILLAKLRALFTDFLLYSKSDFVETIIFKKNTEKKEDNIIKEISELKIHVGMIGDKFKVLTVADENVKDAKFLTEKVLNDVLRKRDMFEVKSIRLLFDNYLGIDTSEIKSELELLVPYIKNLDKKLAELKRKQMPYPDDISLKLLFSSVYFTTLAYILVNRGYHIYIYSDRDDYQVLDHIKDLYYAGGFPIQIITKEIANKIRNMKIGNNFPNAINKNLFISSLKSFKKTSFVVRLSGLSKEDIEKNETSYIVIEDRTEGIQDGTTHHIFTIYKIKHTFLSQQNFQNINEIRCLVEAKLYRKYLSFCHIGDYINNIINDLLMQPKTKVFILRKSSIESIRFSSNKIITATILDPDAIFLKSGIDKGRISIIGEKDIEYMLERIFEGNFPHKKYMFGISPTYVEQLISDFVDSKKRHSFHTDVKAVIVDDISDTDRKILLVDLLSIMHFEAEGFSEESSLSKIDLTFSRSSPALNLLRDGIEYRTKLNHMIMETLGLVGTGILNKKRKSTVNQSTTST